MKFLSKIYLNLMSKQGVSKLIKNVQKVMKIEELRQMEEDISN